MKGFITQGVIIAVAVLAFAGSYIAYQRNDDLGALRVFTTSQGGTGTGNAPSTGEVLVGQSDGTYAPQATSTLGIVSGGVSSASDWVQAGGYLTPSTTIGISVDSITTPYFDAQSSGGGTLRAFGGSNVMLFGSGSSQNATFYGGVNIDGQTRISTNLTGYLYSTAGVLSTTTINTSAEVRIVNLTIASSSPLFTSGELIPALGNKDALEITEYRCYVIGGVSKTVNITDGTNDTETITCNNTMTSDTDVATNDTFTADEIGYVEMGASVGVVNYLHFEAWANVI